ncbi:RIP metalloprotease RseP [Thioalkalivibrio sulfidiphilus]|uniref:Zinc metalloprotease n=1 Tax=Thioalkalivibrio sulfidiphilus (strain HL-EbGR7) TaxID=396588 RepID=B8GQ57_THISH|nr:RIP metalloprotease RseP [Thioalkalivibrio sulfidiphilus]ACL72252.1 membrane-associated zinc metalloprotease [Thioalkalivibrio sulfidiphilus HL-EbGr7]
MSILISIAAFVVAIGVLVTVHEYGHYWVARRAGVKVLRFSVGFGRPLWRRVAGADRTEYVIAAIPLGGYVKMLDERDPDTPPGEDLSRAFNRQPVGKRIAIVAAGPAFNFLFAILAYWLMFMVGIGGVKPVVGEVAPASLAAEAGFVSGDRLISVADTETPTWELASLALLERSLDSQRVAVRVETADGREFVRWLDLSDTRRLLDEGPLLDKIGITPWRPRLDPVLGELVSGGPAVQAGLQSGDRVLAADGEPVHTWQGLVEHIQARPDGMMQLEVERDGSRLQVAVRTGSREDNGRIVGIIGAYPHVDTSQFEAMRTTVRHGPVESFVNGVTRTWDMTVLTLRVLWRLVMGEASVKNISGPISIAEYAGVTAVIGVAAFLGFMAIVSISLGIINLLPIPMLDGGHLLYYLVEIVKGSPVSPQVEAIGQRVGLVMIALLMTLAFYNDIMRILG